MSYQEPNVDDRDNFMESSASRLAVIHVLYDEAIAALQAAIDAIEDGDIERRFNSIAMASEFIAHLYMTLDVQRGGEVAENLARIYSFILGNLAFVNIHNDPQIAKDAIALLEPLRDSWQELDARLAAAGANASYDSEMIEPMRKVATA